MRPALILLLAASPACAQVMAAPESLFPYARAGPFVTVPARFLSGPVYGTAFMAGALACLPVSLAQDPRMEGKVARDKHASVICGSGLAQALGWPVYAAAGLPFFLIKGLFWDGPRAALGMGR